MAADLNLVEQWLEEVEQTARAVLGPEWGSATGEDRTDAHRRAEEIVRARWGVERWATMRNEARMAARQRGRRVANGNRSADFDALPRPGRSRGRRKLERFWSEM